MISFIKTTVIGGLLFLIPFAVLVIVFEKITPVAAKIIAPIAEMIPVESVVGLDVPVMLAIAVILVTCFVIGLFARTRIASGIVGTLEQSILGRIPGYSLLKSVSEDITETKSPTTDHVVLVQFDDAWQLALKVEELNEGGLVAIFVPDSPTPETGSVMIVSADRIVPANMPIMAAFGCLRGRGAGISGVLKTKEQAEAS